MVGIDVYNRAVEGVDKLEYTLRMKQQELDKMTHDRKDVND